MKCALLIFDNKPAEIAAGKDTSGMRANELIRQLEQRSAATHGATTWKPAKIEPVFAGTGVGRPTIDQLITDDGLGHRAVRQKMEKEGIKVHRDGIKGLADLHDFTPIKILTVIPMDKTELAPSAYA